MRQGEPNPLQRELARCQQAGPHPDADLLAALAEGSLLEREREEMFAHLANCAECREVLNVASGAADNPIVESKPFLTVRPTHAPIRRWIPWASIAAGIVLVSTVGLEYRQRMESTELAAAGNTAETSTTNQPLPPVSAEPRSGVSTTAAKPMAEKLKSVESAREAAPIASFRVVPAEEHKQSDATDTSAQMQTPDARATQQDGVAADQAQVRIQAQIQPQAQVQPARAFAAQEPGHMLSKTSPASATPRPRWRIDSSGAAERSIGAGGWQRILPYETAKMRVVGVLNADVWLGGENTRLYHSSDSGNTWDAITLPAKGGHDHAIAHISFKTRQMVTVEAEDGTSWSTTDGGASWK